MVEESPDQSQATQEWQFRNDLDLDYEYSIHQLLTCYKLETQKTRQSYQSTHLFS